MSEFAPPTTEGPRDVPSRARYYVLTTLFAFLVLPLGAAMAGSLAVLVANSQPAVTICYVVPIALVAGLFWAFWGGRYPQPDTWFARLAPLTISCAWFIVSYLVPAWLIGAGSEAFSYTAWISVPWLPASFFLALTGTESAWPILIGTYFAVSALAYIIANLLRAAEFRKRIGWLWTALIAAVLTGAVVYVMSPAVQGVVLEDDETVDKVTDSLLIDEYRPFGYPQSKIVQPDTPASLQITSDFPVLDGATAFYPVYSAVANATYVPPSTEANALRAFTDNFVICRTTPYAFEYLIDGKVDVIFTFAPSAEQAAAAEAAGKQLTLTPIGQEAFVFFVNSGNLVDSLTVAQARDIYTGKLTNWNQLGGQDMEIQAFQREAGSGSQTIMLSAVMQGEQMMPAPRERIEVAMAGMANKVADYRNYYGAVGYSFRWYLEHMHDNPQLKLLKMDGVAPDTAMIANGTYPLTVPFYAITAGTTNANTQKLIDWLVSDEGQALIEKVGYVGINP
ncbi:MAG: substrate-binding domain-containing protein [Propionibacteriaceae bacterium]|nr:substrate-binding domain-containing protein [Propionibacteriaceae bacterium]